MTPEPEFEINEQTWFEVTFSFEDPDGGLVVPAAVRWQLWNFTADEEVQAWEDLTPASQIVLNVDAQLLQIADVTLERELFQLVLQADDGLDTSQTAQIYFDVLNVPNVGGTSP